MLQNNHENVHFLVKKVEKGGNFAFWSTSKLMVIFSGTKNHLYTSLTQFWDALYISFSHNKNFLISLTVVLNSLWVTDIGNMCHYMLVKFVCYGYCSRGPCLALVKSLTITESSFSRMAHPPVK